MDDRGEEESLGSVALKNAQSILHARQRAELELVRLLEFHDVVLANMVEGLYAVGTHGLVTYINPAAEHMLGWASVEVLGRRMYDLIHPKPAEGAENKGPDDNAVLKEQDDTFIKKDGTHLPVTFSSAPIQSGGQVVGMVIVFRDAGDRRRAEEVRAHLAAVVASSEDAIVSKNLDGIIRTWNRGASRVFGYAAEEVIGKPITILLPTNRLHEETEILRRLRRGERLEHFDTVRVHKDGHLIEVSVTISPIRDATGKVIGASKIARDITARKRAEQRSQFLADANAALAEVTDYESTLQKIASLAVPSFADWCAVDMVDANGSVRRLAVMHCDAAKVQLVHEIQQRFPLPPTCSRGVSKVLRTREADWAAKVTDAALTEIAQNDKHLQLLRELGLKSYICVPLHSHAKAIGALTFVTAESDRTYTLDDLRSAEDLAHRAVIAIENANLLAALKETDRRKDEFLAILAHELRNPLAPIRDAVEIMKLQAAGDGQIWARDVIDRQVQQMTRLIEDLVDVSRISRGKIVLRREQVKLAAIVADAVEASRPLIERRGHQLTVSLPDEALGITGDQTRLAQVLANLLNNAAKYTDEGGQIWLSAARVGAEVVIRVKDNGVGIAADMLPHIFDMFTQADASLERSHGGLGIGLTLVQRLVALHGGTVTALSQGPGQGSEFVIHLPCAAPAQVAVVPAPASESHAAARPLRILVVDDNQDGAHGLAKLLTLLGHQVDLAFDGLEAVRTAAAVLPEVVFLDIGLPKLNGYMVARKIRAAQGNKVVLIALTGWGQEADRRRSKEMGFDFHVTKPIEFVAIKKLLSSLAGVPTANRLSVD